MTSPAAASSSPRRDEPDALIETGTLTPGVDPADFAVPSDTALRWEMPAGELRPYLSHYNVFDSRWPERAGAIEWMLPSWPAIRIILAERPLVLTVGNRRYDPLPTATLFGTTTRAARLESNGGVTIGASIGPLGWSRLFSVPADRARDRIVPLAEMMPARAVEALVADLAASDRSTEVKPILDAFFREHMLPPSPDEPLIRQVLTLLGDESVDDLTAAAARIGITSARLRRLSTRYFGFPPKTLLMRARLMRAFFKLRDGGANASYEEAADGFHDVPHLLRDSNRFLGMTPRRFLAMDTPYLDACLRAHRLVRSADRAARKGAIQQS